MFDKGNMFNALRQAQNMKKQLKKVNKQLEKSYFDCNSKNDEGKMKIISLKLSESFSNANELTQQQLLLSTINNAINIAQKESQKQMNAVTGGMLGDMKIPGL